MKILQMGSSLFQEGPDFATIHKPYNNMCFTEKQLSPFFTALNVAVAITHFKWNACNSQIEIVSSYT